MKTSSQWGNTTQRHYIFTTYIKKKNYLRLRNVLRLSHIFPKFVLSITIFYKTYEKITVRYHPLLLLPTCLG